jgi:hypothetical protein
MFHETCLYEYLIHTRGRRVVECPFGCKSNVSELRNDTQYIAYAANKGVEVKDDDDVDEYWHDLLVIDDELLEQYANYRIPSSDEEESDGGEDDPDYVISDFENDD